eukprot:15004948-Alexandrium_andersonii.AAC.1
MAVVPIGTNCCAMVFSLYGWASCAEGSRFAMTSGLVEAAMAEAKSWPRMPVLLMGDLNGEVRQIATPAWEIAAGNL